MTIPAIRDLSIYRGDNYRHEIIFTNDADPPLPLNVSDYTFKAHIRDRPENGSDIYATFTIDDSDAVAGVIVLELAAADTRIPPGYWDLQVEDEVESTIQTWLRGSVTMLGDVTV